MPADPLGNGLRDGFTENHQRNCDEADDLHAEVFQWFGGPAGQRTTDRRGPHDDSGSPRDYLEGWCANASAEIGANCRERVQSLGHGGAARRLSLCCVESVAGTGSAVMIVPTDAALSSADCQ